MRDTVTDLLDLAGLVLIAVALALLTLRWGWDCAAATFGVALLAISALISARGRRRGRRNVDA